MVLSYIKRVFKTLYLALKIALWFFYAGTQRFLFKDKSKLEKRSHDFFDEFGQMLYDELGSMKGPLMKVGQFLSMVDILPKSFQKNLDKLLDNSEPMADIHFAQVIEEEFKVPCSELFNRWDNKVYATGSIGQVFKAEIHDGTTVAVKIRYKDIEAKVRGDMRVVKLFKYAIKAFFRRYNIYGTIKYLEKIMLNECDLITEAKNYKVLQKIFSAHDDLIIPDVYSSLCSRRVLTTKFYEGQRISEILPQLDLEEKIKLKQLVDRFYFYPIKRYNFIQIDPHLGNFLYCEGKLVCVDFGGMHLMRSEVGEVLNNYIKYANKADVISLYKLFSEKGLIDSELISLAVFTKYMAYAIINPFGINNNEGINNLNYYFKNYPNEPLRSGVITKDSDLPLFVLTYFVFRSIEKRILS